MSLLSEQSIDQIDIHVDEAISFVARKKFPEIENELQKKALHAFIVRMYLRYSRQGLASP